MPSFAAELSLIIYEDVFQRCLWNCPRESHQETQHSSRWNCRYDQGIHSLRGLTSSSELSKVYFPVGRTPSFSFYAAGAPPDELGYVNQHGLSRKVRFIPSVFSYLRWNTDQHIFDSVKASLVRLQLDYIDVLQCGSSNHPISFEYLWPFYRSSFWPWYADCGDCMFNWLPLSEAHKYYRCRRSTTLSKLGTSDISACHHAGLGNVSDLDYILINV